MFYFDTSFLTPLIRVEATTARIERFVGGLPRDRLATSQRTRVEFSSVLGREVRMGRLDPRQAAAEDARFENLAGTSFVLLLPTAGDYGLAKCYIGDFSTGLRGPDALHLAVAANNAAEAIYSLDTGLLAAGRAWGLPMSAGIEE